MEAKDTVMKLEVVSPKFPDYIPCAVWDVLDKQAEISFKAGFEEGRKLHNKPVQKTEPTCQIDIIKGGRENGNSKV